MAVSSEGEDGDQAPQQKQLALKLQHNGKIINSTMTIKISNLDDIMSLGFVASLVIYHRQSSEQQWRCKHFDLRCVTHDSLFHLKVPLYLLSYTLQYKVECTMQPKVERHSHFASDIYEAHIPSILIDSSFKIGDHVRFDTDWDDCWTGGTIVQLMDNEMVKIKGDLPDQDEVILSAAKLGFYPIEAAFVVDLTDKQQAVLDLIVNTRSDEQRAMFLAIACGAKHLYETSMHAERISLSSDVLQSLANLIAMSIYECLYESHTQYRIGCMLGDTYLLQQQSWRDFVRLSWWDDGEIVDGESDVQTLWNYNCYSCDICRVQVNWYEYMFGCACKPQNEFDDGHAFCVSCIHSIVTQYNELEPFLSAILADVVDPHCIHEIAAFCVGNITRFHSKNFL